ncbi:MAG: AAA family ATPase [Chitinophagaceae bacterium]
MKIAEIHIENFKSIRNLELKFNSINILIGGNGAGKSNLISYFKLLNNISTENLQSFVSKNSGADTFLYFGKKNSKYLSSEIIFSKKKNQNSYSFQLGPTSEDNFYFEKERIGFDKGSLGKNWYSEDLGSGHLETKLFDNLKKHESWGVSDYVAAAFKQFKVYHFHDTSDTASVKQTSNINDNAILREDASNLASFLYKLQKVKPENFKQIEAIVKLVAPFFQKFNLNPNQLDPEKIRIEWLEVGSDKYFNANNLSDGTLRMICLATLLLQPNPPSTIIIDEPELGLHPSAINVLAALIKSVSLTTQIIISTQSVTLINQFAPENIIIVDRKEQQSSFRHISENELEGWKEEYALGEIWEKNIIGGRP